VNTVSQLRCDCGCDDMYRVGSQYLLMNNPGQHIPSALTVEERQALLHEEPQCRWCQQDAVAVEHNHFTNHVRGTTCQEHNAWWRELDAERYEGRVSPSSPPFYKASRLRVLFRTQVSTVVSALEWAQFQHVEHRHQINEVRNLALEQLDDDKDESSAQRLGSRPVIQWWDMEGLSSLRQLWPARTDAQYETADRVSEVVERVLSAEQQVLVRLRYGGSETYQQIADQYGTTRQAVEQRFKTINKKLGTFGDQLLVREKEEQCASANLPSLQVHPAP